MSCPEEDLDQGGHFLLRQERIKNVFLLQIARYQLPLAYITLVRNYGN